MRIDRNGKLYKFAYWFEKDENEPKEHVSLCAFFWRVVLLAPLFYSFATVMVTAAAIVTSPLWVPIWIYSKVKGVTFEEAAATHLATFPDKPSVQWIAQKKRKVCPLIQIEG